MDRLKENGNEMCMERFCSDELEMYNMVEKRLCKGSVAVNWQVYNMEMKCVS